MFTPRSINSIYSDIISEKSSFSTLTGLTSPAVDLPSLLTELDSGSQVAIWNLWAYVNAFSIYTLEQNYQNCITDVETAKASAAVGNLRWYIAQTLLFQYGDILSIDPITFKPYYETINTSNQIILYSNAIESLGNLIIKVRRKDADLLSNDEKSSLLGYLHNIKFVGTRIFLVNELPDRLWLPMTIYYNQQMPITEVETQVGLVISNYAANIEFDSQFKTNKMIDALQTLPFIVDVNFTTLYARKDSDSVFTPFQWAYSSWAGYMVIDDPDHPLSDTITYVAVAV